MVIYVFFLCWSLSLSLYVSKDCHTFRLPFDRFHKEPISNQIKSHIFGNRKNRFTCKTSIRTKGRKERTKRKKRQQRRIESLKATHVQSAFSSSKIPCSSNQYTQRIGEQLRYVKRNDTTNWMLVTDALIDWRMCFEWYLHFYWFVHHSRSLVSTKCDRFFALLLLIRLCSNMDFCILDAHTHTGRDNIGYMWFLWFRFVR